MSKYKPPTNLLPLKLSLSVQSRFCAMDKPPAKVKNGFGRRNSLWPIDQTDFEIDQSSITRFLKKGSNTRSRFTWPPSSTLLKKC
ncbi:hypothetical protein BRARA_J02739 [Brassica rapa]|uniref:Uncharacterized protein n=1 Tax=Brassica campestris TaxID=3711 RepID=A0A397XNZ8_BRACM|nr:hypothetical protein BRARA_J02739 [Brassica rapa]